MKEIDYSAIEKVISDNLPENFKTVSVGGFNDEVLKKAIIAAIAEYDRQKKNQAN